MKNVIDPHSRRLLTEMINRKINILESDSKRDEENKIEIRDRIREQFELSRNNSIYKVTYQELNSILSLAGISHREFLEYVLSHSGSEPKNKLCWPSAEDEMLADYLDSVDDDAKGRIREIIEELLTDEAKSIIGMDGDFKTRSLYAMEYKLGNWGGGLKIYKEKYGNTSIWKSKRSGATNDLIPIEKFPMISKDTGISIHWIMNAPETETILAGNANTELIMDEFGFLSGNEKKVLYGAVKIKKNIMKFME